jgi:DNA-binding NtrC family response regulator
MNPELEKSDLARILIVDDEEDLVNIMRMALRQMAVDITTAHDGDEAIRLLENESFDLIISDQNMPGALGTQVLEHSRKLPEPPLFILITAFGTIDLAVDAMRSGAYDFIKKPFEIEEFVGHIRNALDTLELTRENRLLRQTVESHYVFSEIIGTSKPLHDILDIARRASEKDSPVLILGESGTGKDLLARAIHLHGPRSTRSFIPINCGAIPESLMESEFFGHKRGAFTGAISDRKGCFEEVAGGTLFLDEIGEMPLDMQVKLLRVLEEGKIRRIGENHERNVSFRVISATNKPITDMVNQNSFRQDLFYRLNVLTITIPPLRDRREDIIPLAKHFLKTFAGNHNTEPARLSPATLDILQTYPFPGNVRELQNILERALLLSDSNTIEPAHLPGEVQSGTETRFDEPLTLDMKMETKKAQEAVEQRLIVKALKQAKNNHKLAAELLGISRGSLYNKLQRLQLN